MSVEMRELEARLNNLAKVDLMQGVKKATAHVQQEAKALCGGFKISKGELRQSIYTATEYEGDICRGVCYTNKEYAPYVEFGTGPVGQKNHEGISPNVAIAYSQSGWRIPASAMSVEDAEVYGLGIARNSAGEVIGYYTNGQPAHPFMYPALKNSEKEVEDIIANELRSQL